jgi:hypothetical protein
MGNMPAYSREAMRCTIRHIVILGTGAAALSSVLSIQRCPPLHEHGDIISFGLKIILPQEIVE